MTPSSKNGHSSASRFIPSEEIGEGQVRQWQFGDMAQPGNDGFIPLHALGGVSLDPLLRARPLGGPAAPEPAAQEDAAPTFSEDDVHRFAEEARAEGQRQGLLQGVQQGIEQARNEASAQLAQVEQQWQQKLDEYEANIGREAAQHLSAVVAEAQAGIRGLQQHMAPQLLQLAVDIARQVVRQELRCNPLALLPVVREALDMLGAESKPTTVRINPEDWAQLERHLRSALPNPRVEWLADASVPRGGCRVQAAGAAVDGTVERRWQRAVAALGLVSTWYEDSPAPPAPAAPEASAAPSPAPAPAAVANPTVGAAHA